MNKKLAKTFSFKEAIDLLPEWYVNSIDISLSIVKHNSFVYFYNVKDFLTNSLEHTNVSENKEIKYVKIEIEDKGIHFGCFLFTINFFVKLKNEKRFWKFSKSAKAKIREKMKKYTD